LCANVIRRRERLPGEATLDRWDAATQVSSRDAAGTT
jgi:hypothetical protein